MSILNLKVLLRKGEIAQSILAIALLVAIMASINAIVNYLNLQSETLTGPINPSARAKGIDHHFGFLLQKPINDFY